MHPAQLFGLLRTDLILIIIGCAITAASATSGCSRKTSTAKQPSAAEARTHASAAATHGAVIGRAINDARAIAASQVSVGELLKAYTPQLTALQTALAQV